MRLLVRRIYRAFPELDRYSDEQCSRFVRAANRGWRRWRHALLITLAVGVVFVVAGWVGDKAFEVANEYQDRMRRDVLWANLAAAGVTIPLMVLGPVAGLFVRDRLLRSRINRILRQESSCPKCSYRLMGLPVSQQATITCPECGMVVAVDPSLGELTINAAGVEEYRPAVIVPPPPPFWTRRNRRIVIRVVAATILIPLMIYGGVTWWVEHQVSAALASRPRVPQSVIEARQPEGGGPGTDNGWGELQLAMEAVQVADQKIGVYGYGFYGHPTKVLLSAPQSTPATQPQLDLDRAGRLMDQYRADGVYDRLGKMAACRRAACPSERDWLSTRMTIGWPGQPAELAGICEVRLKLARRAGDMAEFGDALAQYLALARVLRQQTDGVSLDLSTAIELDAFTELRALLATHPSKEWLDLVDNVVKRQQTDLPTQDILTGDKIGVVQAICGIFMQLGEGSLPAWRFVQGEFECRRAGKRIGSFAENRDLVNDYFSQMEAFAELPPYKRPAIPPLVQPGDLSIIGYVFPDESGLISNLDRNLLARRGFATLMALERYRMARGQYPKSLEELVPEFLPALPEDPWSGKPLGFVVVDPAKDRQGRSFLLYSVGNDRMDNQGAFVAQQIDKERLLDVSTLSSASGLDYIVNESTETETKP